MAARLDAVEETRRQLLADLAHELRTPIATLSAHHEAMADGVIEADAAMPILAGQTVRLSRLADDISEVSRAEEGQLPVQLHPLAVEDRKSTRLNSSHVATSYAVVCLEKHRE